MGNLFPSYLVQESNHLCSVSFCANEWLLHNTQFFGIIWTWHHKIFHTEKKLKFLVLEREMQLNHLVRCGEVLGSNPFSYGVFIHCISLYIKYKASHGNRTYLLLTEHPHHWTKAAFYWPVAKLEQHGWRECPSFHSFMPLKGNSLADKALCFEFK